MSDLCFFQDLDIGEYFYLPFQGDTLEKVSPTSFEAPSGEWPVEPFDKVAGAAAWIVGRVSGMTCRRCGCTERSACHDERMDGPCGWAMPGLCTACLSANEFREWLDRQELEVSESPAIPMIYP